MVGIGLRVVGEGGPADGHRILRPVGKGDNAAGAGGKHKNGATGKAVQVVAVLGRGRIEHRIGDVRQGDRRVGILRVGLAQEQRVAAVDRAEIAGATIGGTLDRAVEEFGRRRGGKGGKRDARDRDEQSDGKRPAHDHNSTSTLREVHERDTTLACGDRAR